MNIARANLNLLVIFDKLMSELNLTRAGEQLSLSQPAMSHALRHLRKMFDDELLVRSRGKLYPTEKACELIVPIREALQILDLALSSEYTFNPKISEREFNLAATPYLSSLITSPLLQAVRKEAPNVKINIRSYDSADTFNHVRELEQGGIDLIIGNITEVRSPLRSEALFSDEVICLADKGNTIIKKRLTLKKYLELEHISLDVKGNLTFSSIDQKLADLGLERLVVMCVPYLPSIPEAIEGSDFAASYLRKDYERRYSHSNLTCYKLPYPLEPINFMQVWHSYQENNEANKWLRSLIKRVLEPYRDNS
jgi:DNA-binding transcriptional LysR family regulator